ncbi:MAG TPA: hypothetical protein VGO93_26125, partial [Candidatus Xenobia bacterium]
RALDPTAVRYLGTIPFDQTWDYLHHADVGVVVSAGPFMHNNESSKIYYYLRCGLPVVSESGFPNDYVVEESGHGVVVESGNLECMASTIEEVAHSHWSRAAAVSYILERHTWDHRAQTYRPLMECRS